MSRPAPARTGRGPAAALAVAVAVVLLAGCSDGGGAEAEQTPAPTATPTATPTVSPTPSPTPSVDPPPTPGEEFAAEVEELYALVKRSVEGSGDLRASSTVLEAFATTVALLRCPCTTAPRPSAG